MGVWKRSHRRFRAFDLPLTEEEKEEKRQQKYTLTGWAAYTGLQYTLFTDKGMSPPEHYFFCEVPPTQKQYTFSEWSTVDEFYAMGLSFTSISFFSPQESMSEDCGGVHTPILGVSPGDLIGTIVWEEEYINPNGPDLFYLCKEFEVFTGVVPPVGVGGRSAILGGMGVVDGLFGIRIEEQEERGCCGC